MPLVEPPKSCEGCGACCHKLIVTLAPGEEVPEDSLIEKGDDWYWQMKQREDGSCLALDRSTMLCTIYDDRPNVCRDFGPEDNQACLDSVYRRQQIVMDAAAQQVEDVLKCAAEFALACGFAPTMRTKFEGTESHVRILFQPTLMGPDVRPQVLGDSLTRIRDNVALQQRFIEVPRA